MNHAVNKAANINHFNTILSNNCPFKSAFKPRSSVNSFCSE